MSSFTAHHDGDEDGQVFIDEDDIVQEIPIDEEELPDASDSNVYDGLDDDSIHIFTGHTDELYSVACSPTDPTLVATGGKDDRGFLWGVGQGDWAFELQGHTDTVSSVDFSADGQLLASGSLDGLVKIWEVSTRSLKCSLDGPAGGIEWVRWHPTGHVILAGSEDGSAWMWNADKSADEAYLNMFQGHSNIHSKEKKGHSNSVTCGESEEKKISVTCGDFTPDGKTVCTGSNDASMRIWNPRNREAIHVIRGNSYHTQGLTCLTISSNSTLALTGSKDTAAHIVNIGTGKVVGSLQSHSESVECVGFSSSYPWVATGGLDNKLILWDISSCSPRLTLMHEEGVTCLSWLGASRYLASGSLDGKVRIWDSLSGERVRTYNGHAGAILSIAVSANGDFLISASMDHTARAFEIPDFH